MSSAANNGFSSGNVSSRRWSGSVNCHVNNITKSTDSNPDTILYSFHGSTFFYGNSNQSGFASTHTQRDIERKNKANWNIFDWKQKMLYGQRTSSFFKQNKSDREFVFFLCYCLSVHTNLWILLLFRCKSMDTPYLTEHSTVGQSKTSWKHPGSRLTYLNITHTKCERARSCAWHEKEIETRQKKRKHVMVVDLFFSLSFCSVSTSERLHSFLA